MRARILGFVNALRDAGIRCAVSETLDANRAVAMVGIAHAVLRETLAATLIKDHADRPIFDAVFDRYFGVPRRARARRRAPQDDDGAGLRGQGDGVGRGERPHIGRTGLEQRQEQERDGEAARRAGEKLAARDTLLTKPFESMDARDVEEIRVLLDDLGRRFRVRWSRRLRRAHHGRIDMRRTIRRATTRGGVPLELFQRRPRPGKTDLVALVDLSYSAATAADFLLALLTPARRFFRRVVLFAYVDHISELAYEQGHAIPLESIDLNARSDFGRVLTQIVARHAPRLTRNTVLLILGDARNNRRPPRADMLAALAKSVRAVIWLNPERRERWNTGDSVMSTYARHCTIVVNAWNLETLTATLDRLSRMAV